MPQTSGSPPGITEASRTEVGSFQAGKTQTIKTCRRASGTFRQDTGSQELQATTAH
jgi:hypothetical protein